MMTPFDYNYQNPSISLFVMLIRAIVMYVNPGPLGFQNLNNKGKTMQVVVVN